MYPHNVAFIKVLVQDMAAVGSGPHVCLAVASVSATDGGSTLWIESNCDTINGIEVLNIFQNHTHKFENLHAATNHVVNNKLYEFTTTAKHFGLLF